MASSIASKIHDYIYNSGLKDSSATRKVNPELKLNLQKTLKQSEPKGSARSLNRESNSHYTATTTNHKQRASIDNKSELLSGSHGSSQNKNGLEALLSARTTEIKADPRLTQALSQISARTF